MSTLSQQPTGSADPTEAAAPAAWRQAEAWRTAGQRPELAKPRRHADAVSEWLASRVVAGWPPVRRYLRIADAVVKLEPTYRELAPVALGESLTNLRDRYRLGRTKPDDRLHALAAVREAGVARSA